MSASILQVNIQLKPGAATETVEVTAAPPQLQTEDASVGQVVTEKSVNSLPLNGRNFTFLAQLGAGVQSPQADTRGNAASGAFSANGLRPAQNNYLLDGIDNNSNAVDFLNGTNFVVLPPVDAISEFKVQTANFSAELGRSAGAVLNATIKSGTNSIHGAAWEFFRNDVLDAADWFENNAGIQKGRLRLNQFGVAVGGPIIKDKIFFFGDYEGLRRVQGTTFSGLAVPTVARAQLSGFTNLSGSSHCECRGTPEPTPWAERYRSARFWILPQRGQLQRARLILRVRLITATEYRLCSRSVRLLHRVHPTTISARRLSRPESYSWQAGGSERRQADESLPGADHVRESHRTMHRARDLSEHRNAFDIRGDVQSYPPKGPDILPLQLCG